VLRRSRLDLTQRCEGLLTLSLPMCVLVSLARHRAFSVGLAGRRAQRTGETLQSLSAAPSRQTLVSAAVTTPTEAEHKVRLDAPSPAALSVDLSEPPRARQDDRWHQQAPSNVGSWGLDPSVMGHSRPDARARQTVRARDVAIFYSSTANAVKETLRTFGYRFGARVPACQSWRP